MKWSRRPADSHYSARARAGVPAAVVLPVRGPHLRHRGRAQRLRHPRHPAGHLRPGVVASFWRRSTALADAQSKWCSCTCHKYGCRKVKHDLLLFFERETLWRMKSVCVYHDRISYDISLCRTSGQSGTVPRRRQSDRALSTAAASSSCRSAPTTAACPPSKTPASTDHTSPKLAHGTSAQRAGSGSGCVNIQRTTISARGSLPAEQAVYDIHFVMSQDVTAYSVLVH